MQVGDLVSVRTKHYGTKLGLIVENVADSAWGYFSDTPWRVKMLDHPRDVYAAPCDVEVINANR